MLLCPRPGLMTAVAYESKGVRMRVLVIEDHAEMAKTVAVGLRRAEMAVDIASDGPSGLERALNNDYDVVVLDRDLPGLHGDEVCVQLMEAGRRSRVLMLTAAADADDLVEGLNLGADDYLSREAVGLPSPRRPRSNLRPPRPSHGASLADNNRPHR